MVFGLTSDVELYLIGCLCSRSSLTYFLGRLGTAGGARPVDTPGLEGTERKACLVRVKLTLKSANLMAAVAAHPNATWVDWAPWAGGFERGTIVRLKNESHRMDQNHRTVSRFLTSLSLTFFSQPFTPHLNIYN